MPKAGDTCYKVFKGQRSTIVDERALLYKWAPGEEVNFELRRK